jgi:hypothetical protein
VAVTTDELGAFRIRRVIFHDIPRHVKNSESAPRLSEVETKIEARQREHLHDRMVRILGSKSAYDIEFDPLSGSPVPDIVRVCTGDSAHKFVQQTHVVARYLHEQQVGSSPAGLLTVIEGTTLGHRGLAILKLEREEGAQLEFDEAARTFSMDVLENLVLTEGTRLFKSALFIRTGNGPDDLRAVACDSQRSFASPVELARFWMRFLGCRLTEEPHITTKRFYETTLQFIEDAVTDPVQKTALYNHLVSEISSERRTFAPNRFVEDYVPPEYREPLREFLTERHVSLRQFSVDLSEIDSRLRRRSYDTKNGVRVVVPEEHADLVDVNEETILVRDVVTRVGR